MKMKLNVGQIVYIIPEKQTVVYPMQVVEEITKRMLGNASEVVTETDYALRSGGSNPKLNYLSNIQGEVFESSEHARTAMIERATRSINKHIEVAIGKASEWYGNHAKVHLDEENEEFDENDETALVDLGNGVKGRIKMNT